MTRRKEEKEEELLPGAVLVCPEKEKRQKVEINVDCSPPWWFMALIVTDIIVLEAINILLLLFRVS